MTGFVNGTIIIIRNIDMHCFLRGELKQLTHSIFYWFVIFAPAKTAQRRLLIRSNLSRAVKLSVHVPPSPQKPRLLRCTELSFFPIIPLVESLIFSFTIGRTIPKSP
jgi:hypothetical protein